MSLVLDASMAICWLFEEERTEAAYDVMIRTEIMGAHVPSLWRLEIANVLRTAMRKGRCNQNFADNAFAQFGRLAIVVDDETDGRAWREILLLSRQEDLTAYDAAYLELAIRHRLPLATCDAALIVAARRRGLDVLTA